MRESRASALLRLIFTANGAPNARRRADDRSMMSDLNSDLGQRIGGGGLMPIGSPLIQINDTANFPLRAVEGQAACSMLSDQSVVIGSGGLRKSERCA